MSIVLFKATCDVRTAFALNIRDCVFHMMGVKLSQELDRMSFIINAPTPLVLYRRMNALYVKQASFSVLRLMVLLYALRMLPRAV